MRITPFFELNGNRYEFQKTQWLIAEYHRLNEECPLSKEDRANTLEASNLVADVKKYAEKEKECWENLCQNPTEDNQRIYLLFKGMSDKAIADYNAFISSNDSIQTAAKHNIDILEKVAIKGLAERYYDMNEMLARQTWEMFVDEMDNPNKVTEWLTAMAECLFDEDDEVDEDNFLSQKRKADEARANNRQNALRKKR